jgi:hypothetical protein
VPAVPKDDSNLSRLAALALSADQKAASEIIKRQNRALAERLESNPLWREQRARLTALSEWLQRAKERDDQAAPARKKRRRRLAMTKAAHVKRVLEALYPPHGQSPQGALLKTVTSNVNGQLAKERREPGTPPVTASSDTVARVLGWRNK